MSNDKFDISIFKGIAEVFSLAWFGDRKNEGHILFKINKRLKDNLTKRVRENLEYIKNVDALLRVLKKENLISKDVKTKLRNPPQFQDTLSEIKACCYLISNGIKNVRLCRNFPDIEIPDRNMIIEVKNLHIAQRLLNSNGQVVYLDDIRRIWSKLSEEILPKLENSKINIILFDVPVEVGFDEFEDLFVYSEEMTINLQTNEVIPLFRGKFSKKENNKVSAVVMLKDNHFRGLINPLNNRIIPHDIKKLFNLIDVRVDKNA